MFFKLDADKVWGRCEWKGVLGRYCVSSDGLVMLHGDLPES